MKSIDHVIKKIILSYSLKGEDHFDGFKKSNFFFFLLKMFFGVCTLMYFAVKNEHMRKLSTVKLFQNFKRVHLETTFF